MTLSVPTSPPRQGWIVLTASLGLFLATLDTGIINIALPALTRAFDVPVATMSWAVTLYMLCLIVILLPLGQWADRLGRVKFFSAGLILFLVASVGCALAGSVGWFIAGRALQGLGAAFMQATATALLTTQLPVERRRSGLATLGMIQGLGTVIGPGLGGLLLSTGGWPWLFWINLPLCLLGLYGAQRFFALQVPNPDAAPANLGSSALLGGSLLALFVALDAPGLAPLHAWLGAGVSVVLLVAFFLRERRQPSPLILPEVRRNTTLKVLLGVWATLGLVTPALFLVPPFLWTDVAHLTTWQAGLLALVSPLMFAISARLNPVYKRRFSTLGLLTAGLTLMTVGLAVTGLIAGHGSPVLLTLPLAVYGLGGGAAQVESTTTLTSLVSQDKQATLGATQRLVLNVGIALATAVVTRVIGHGDLLAGSRMVLRGSALIALLALGTMPLLRKPLLETHASP